MENQNLANNRQYKELEVNFNQDVKKRSDRLINYFLAGYFLTGLGLAFYYETWAIALGAGSLSLIAFYSSKIALPNSNLYQYVLSVVLGLFMAQFIYQMHGMFEMHFFAFIGSAILITYQNWKLQIPMMLVVVIHHLAFGYLQNSGIESVYFTQLDVVELRTFIIHFILSGIIFFVCGLWAYQLKKYNESHLRQARVMAQLQQDKMLAANAREQLEQKEKAQQEIAESQLRFAYASQATSDAIWDRSYNDNMFYWGEGFRTLFGYEITPATRSMQFWESKIHPDDHHRVSSYIQAAKENSACNTWTIEYRFLKADSNYSFVREKAIIIRDEKGEISRSLGALQDITESKQNELALKELNESLEIEKYYLDCLMDNMPYSIYFKDKESRFLRVSKYLAETFGKSSDDLVGMSDFDMHDESHARKAYEDEQQIQQTGVPKIDYIEKTTREGAPERWVSTTKLPLLNQKAEVIGTFGMSRDVTKIKALEQERHTAMIEKAVAQGKFEIASDVMHDIGNAVVGFGSYLTRIRRIQENDKLESLQQLIRFFEQQKAGITQAIGEEKSSAVIKMLCGIALTQRSNNEEVSRSITEQLAIITHIQEILNIQRQYISGHESKERQPVNLRNIINDSLSMVFASIDKMAVEVSLNIANDLPIIKGDRTKLMQAMLNIFRNSIEAIDVQTKDKKIAIIAKTEEGRLIVQVKDSGKGFDSTLASQLFTRGFTTKSSGSGLGLYNCRSIIESHDGQIALESEGLNKGCVTTIGFKI
jgi:PAS domain S-box-containing protein